MGYGTGNNHEIQQMLSKIECKSNNAINRDSEKRRAFVAPLFFAGYGERYRSEIR